MFRFSSRFFGGKVNLFENFEHWRAHNLKFSVSSFQRHRGKKNVGKTGIFT